MGKLFWRLYLLWVLFWVGGWLWQNFQVRYIDGYEHVNIKLKDTTKIEHGYYHPKYGSVYKDGSVSGTMTYRPGLGTLHLDTIRPLEPCLLGDNPLPMENCEPTILKIDKDDIIEYTIDENFTKSTKRGRNYLFI